MWGFRVRHAIQRLKCRLIGHRVRPQMITYQRLPGGGFRITVIGGCERCNEGRTRHRDVYDDEWFAIDLRF